MNIMSHESDEQQQRLDRLVDGELPEAERRQLLASLDDQPDGWRRCALAFLEAQSWAEDLRAIAHPAPIVAPPATVQPAVPIRPQSGSSQAAWRRASPGMLAALAASVMLCFALGISAGRWLDRPGPGYRVSASGSAGHSLAAAGVPAARPAAVAESAADHVTLVLAEGRDDAVPVQVPIVKDPALAAGWLNASPALPADVRQALERLGHRVREHRQLIPVRMGDGREVVVPVDRIDLQPVNLKDYQ
ncbi:MAG TPA: hypothetical protein VIK18_21735 [Pirellulales bacterium]